MEWEELVEMRSETHTISLTESTLCLMISKEDFEPRLEQTEIKIVELVTIQELAANFVDLCSERAAKNLDGIV